MHSNNSNTGVAVNILDKEYLISCAEDERHALLASATLLDKSMREIRDSGKVVGSDRIAVMAALNIAHDLLKKEATIDNLSKEESAQLRIQTMQEKIDTALKRQHELEL